MKTITLFAVLAIFLVDALGSKSSVGGPMTDLLVSFLAMLAVGIHEAWSNRRGPLGWVVNIALAIAGGMVALSLMSTAMESLMSAAHFRGQLATSHHPLRYFADVAMPVATVLGSWAAIQLVNLIPARAASLNG